MSHENLAGTTSFPSTLTPLPSNGSEVSEGTHEHGAVSSIADNKENVVLTDVISAQPDEATATAGEDRQLLMIGRRPCSFSMNESPKHSQGSWLTYLRMEISVKYLSSIPSSNQSLVRSDRNQRVHKFLPN